MSVVVAISSKSHNCNTWTPEQCLQAALDELRSGEMAKSMATGATMGVVKQLAVHYYIETPDKRLKPCYYVAGMSHSEYIALLSVSLQTALDDWRNDT